MAPVTGSARARQRLISNQIIRTAFTFAPQAIMDAVILSLGSGTWADWVAAGGSVVGAFGTIASVLFVGWGLRREVARRQRDEERQAVSAARRCLLELQHLHTTDRDDTDPRYLTEAGRGKREHLLRELRAHVSTIRVDEVRNPLEFISGMIGHDAIPYFQGHDDWLATKYSCQYGLNLTSAYMADKPLPVEPTAIQGYRQALHEADECLREQYEEESEMRFGKTQRAH